MAKILLAFITLILAHPFYLGVTDLKYNQKEQALQGSVKLFINDLEDALSRINKKTVDLIHIKDSAETSRMLKAYLAGHLSLSLNNKIRTFELVGFEREEEALWMYIEFKKCEGPKKVQLQNTLLFDYLKEQTNIVHLEAGGSRKSLKASNPEKDFLFEF